MKAKWMLGIIAGLAVLGSLGLAQQKLTEISVYINPATPEAGDPPADMYALKLIRDKLNINIRYIRAPIGNDGATKLASMAAANDLPDLFAIPDRNLFFDLAQKGLLAPVDPIVKLMPGRAKERLSNKNLIQLSSYNGVRYGLLERSLFKNRQGFIVRNDWLKKLNLKAPTNLDEFLEVARAFTFNDPDGNGKNDTYGFGLQGNVSNYASGSSLGLAFANSSGFEWVYGAYGVSSRWNISNTGARANVLDPRYYQATQYIGKLNEAKVVDPDWPTLSVNDFNARWKQGRYGMWIGDFCATMCVQNYPDFDKGNPTAELVYFDPPKGPQGRSAVSLFAQVGTLYAVSKKAVDAGKGEAIARFLEWANSDEGYFALGFGEPGVNFILKSGAVSYEGIEASKTFNSRETGPQQQLKWFALDGNEAELNLRYPSFKSANGRTIVPMDYYRAANKFSYVDTIPQLAIQPAANQADIDRYISEGLTAFALGQRPLNATEWNRFVAGLKRLKFDDYVAAANAALKAAGFVK